jgi:hypothetical protein
MTKLKTLKKLPVIKTYKIKSLKKENNICIGQAIFNHSIDIKILKKEAIKWIKLFESSTEITEDDFYELGLDKFWDEHTNIQQIINWIKHFFNIDDKEVEE